jgi:hypothetical protein
MILKGFPICIPVCVSAFKTVHTKSICRVWRNVIYVYCDLQEQYRRRLPRSPPQSTVTPTPLQHDILYVTHGVRLLTIFRASSKSSPRDANRETGAYRGAHDEYLKVTGASSRHDMASLSPTVWSSTWLMCLFYLRVHLSVYWFTIYLNTLPVAHITTLCYLMWNVN